MTQQRKEEIKEQLRSILDEIYESKDPTLSVLCFFVEDDPEKSRIDVITRIDVINRGCISSLDHISICLMDTYIRNDDFKSMLDHLMREVTKKNMNVN